MMKDPSSPEAWGKDEHRDRNASLANAYQAVLRKTNRLDFDDMLLEAVWTLHDQPEARTAVSRRYRHVLIDEGQDTNAPQYMLARLIAQEHHNVFIVGDPDQAIYGWRGAELRNILDFQKVFPNTRRIDLDTAYRSAAPLLEAAQRMIGHNRERLEHPLRAARKGSALAAVHHAKDATEEATFAIDRASTRIARDNGTSFWQRARHALRAGALPEWHSRGLAQGFDLAKEVRDPARAAPVDDALEAVLGITGYLGALEKSADPDARDRAVMPGVGVPDIAVRRSRVDARSRSGSPPRWSRSWVCRAPRRRASARSASLWRRSASSWRRSASTSTSGRCCRNSLRMAAAPRRKARSAARPRRWASDARSVRVAARWADGRPQPASRATSIAVSAALTALGAADAQARFGRTPSSTPSPRGNGSDIADVVESFRPTGSCPVPAPTPQGQRPGACAPAGWTGP